MTSFMHVFELLSFCYSYLTFNIKFIQYTRANILVRKYSFIKLMKKCFYYTFYDKNASFI